MIDGSIIPGGQSLNHPVAGGALAVVAFSQFVLGHYCERYHADAFREHTARLAAAETDEEIGAELQRFYEDQRVEWAIRGMAYGYPAGYLLFAAAVAVLSF